jgi:hypothetical protein
MKIIAILLGAVLAFPVLAHDVVALRDTPIKTTPAVDGEVSGTLSKDKELVLLGIHPVQGFWETLKGWVSSHDVAIRQEYERSQWRHWQDHDGDCEKARAEVLIAESLIEVTRKAGKPCQVASGRWRDPFSGEEITQASGVDVDHIVPLKNAHNSGGWKWSAAKREEYANQLIHPEHLMAVSASLNRQKGAKGPEEWMPPNAAFHCEYIKAWAGIKERWGLSMNAEEQATVSEHLARCD